MESKQPVETTVDTATTAAPDESKEFILIEQLENSMKIVELEPLAASRITIDLNETNKNSADEIKLEQQSVLIENIVPVVVLDSNKSEIIIPAEDDIIKPVEKIIDELIKNEPIIEIIEKMINYWQKLILLKLNQNNPMIHLLLLVIVRN